MAGYDPKRPRPRSDEADAPVDAMLEQLTGEVPAVPLEAIVEPPPAPVQRDPDRSVVDADTVDVVDLTAPDVAVVSRPSPPPSVPGPGVGSDVPVAPAPSDTPVANRAVMVVSAVAAVATLIALVLLLRRRRH
jgi:hypothetical protein